ncbi:MAG: hypothetical protein SOR93_04185 [Clostridiales Family XIII bacterium]|nr:hypothetical protein [Clostridiales Family XIII bacterium]
MFKEQEVKMMFEKESVLIGHSDVIPERAVERYFGKEALSFAGKCENGKHYNGYGIGNFTAMYLSYKGFQIAATFSNIKEIEKFEALQLIDSPEGDCEVI